MLKRIFPLMKVLKLDPSQLDYSTTNYALCSSVHLSVSSSIKAQTLEDTLEASLK
jgi:hypothetical protein